MNLVLIGTHAAGKTTFGQALAAATGWTFHDELGKDLATDTSYRPVGTRTSDPQPGFDLAVFARERARDHTFAHDHGARTRIVESWHPGNLAYAMSRSPRVVAEMSAFLRDGIDWSCVVVLPIRARAATLVRRKRYPEPLCYFESVSAQAMNIALLHGALVAPPIWTDHDTPEELVSRSLPDIEAALRHVRARQVLVPGSE